MQLTDTLCVDCREAHRVRSLSKNGQDKHLYIFRFSCAIFTLLVQLQCESLSSSNAAILRVGRRSMVQFYSQELPPFTTMAFSSADHTWSAKGRDRWCTALTAN